MTEQESENLTFQVRAEDANVRLDAFLALKIEGWSRSRLQKLVDDGEVLVNGKTAKSSYKTRENDEIEVELVVPTVESFEPQDIPLDIVYEDEEIAVINKPAGMVVHPGAGVPNGTLANAIAYHFKFQISDSKLNNRVGIVHRLDKDTSGLIVVAKNEAAHENLSEQFRERKVFKSYIALVHGETKEESGKIDAAIARDYSNRLRMAVSKQGRNALSSWKVRERFERFTLLDVEIKTGRTHQIRVHLSFMRHPVVGDELYNGGRDNNVPDVKIKTAIAKLNRFFLHAERLSFAHPQTGEDLNFQVGLPQNLLDFLELLRG
jgi:23S rRNA pseudouridine1911/1915/1917 synthase